MRENRTHGSEGGEGERPFLPLSSSPFFKDETSSSSLNGRWERFEVVHANAELLSVRLDISWYGAGAAHPNHYFEGHNFAIIKGKPYPIEIDDMFSVAKDGFDSISEFCKKDIQRQYWERTGNNPDEGALKWIGDGTEPKREYFGAFTIAKDFLTIWFSPYQVAPYVLSAWSVDIPYYELLKVLNQDGPYKLARLS